jgi:hypothetical protein
MKTYLFASKSKPNAPPHRTTLHENGEVTCSCPARVECWHVKKVKIYRDAGPVSQRLSLSDRLMILELLELVNEDDVLLFVFELFPSMSVEEAKAFVEDIRLKHEAFLQSIDDGSEIIDESF